MGDADLTTVANQTVAHGGIGVTTSDEILDTGAKGLTFFADFIPPYNKWTGDSLDLGRDIQAGYDNLRGITFAHFRADAAQLASSHGKLADTTLNLSTAANGLGGFWQGPAAQAAQDHCGTFVQNGQTVTDGLAAASQLITDQMRAIEGAVLQRAQGVVALSSGNVGGFAPSDLNVIIDVARGTASHDDIRSMARRSFRTGVDQSDDRCLTGELSHGVRVLVAKDATEWLNNVFRPAFEDKKSSFDAITEATHATVGQCFDSLAGGLGKINANPFNDPNAGILEPSRPPSPISTTASDTSPPPIPGTATGFTPPEPTATTVNLDNSAEADVGAGTIFAEEQSDGSGEPAMDDGTESLGIITFDADSVGTIPPTLSPSATPTSPVGFTPPTVPITPVDRPPPTGIAPPVNSPSTAAVASNPAPTANPPMAGPPAAAAQDGAGPSGARSPVPPRPPAPPTRQATLVAWAEPNADSALGGAVAASGGAGARFNRGMSGRLGGPVHADNHADASQGPSGDQPNRASGHAGLAGTDVSPMGGPSGAGVASAPMPMMGAGGTGGGGPAGDRQRGPSQWRTQDRLFDDAQDDEVVDRFSGTLDDGH